MTVDGEYVAGLPCPALRPYLDWCTGYREVGGPPSVHRGLPSPQITLIFTLDEPLIMAAHPDSGQPPGTFDALVGGLHTRPALIAYPGRQSGVQLALHPLGARALLGVPAAEIAEHDFHVEDVLGTAFVTQLRERLLHAATWRERLDVIEEFLLERVDAEVSFRPEVAHVWRALLASGGTADVAGLATSVGWSTRYLSTRFRAEFGVGPKSFGRLVRFHRVVGALPRATQAGLSLAEVAAAYGYYDQSHLAAEFRVLAGCPQTTWMAEEFRNFQVQWGWREEESSHDEHDDWYDQY
jgi:AraC-like DNA-binding protein